LPLTTAIPLPPDSTNGVEFKEGVGYRCTTNPGTFDAGVPGTNEVFANLYLAGRNLP
jgi:hypothetical protein